MTQSAAFLSCRATTSRQNWPSFPSPPRKEAGATPGMPISRESNRTSRPQISRTANILMKGTITMATLEITRTQQYLTFNLDDEVFALDISQVREVLDFAPVTKVPQTPHFMRGVINLRGNVVPVVDLRAKFGIPPVMDTENTCIIIVEVEMDGETTILGALADSVKEVIDLDPTQIEPAPR